MEIWSAVDRIGHKYTAADIKFAPVIWNMHSPLYAPFKEIYALSITYCWTGLACSDFPDFSKHFALDINLMLQDSALLSMPLTLIGMGYLEVLFHGGGIKCPHY